MPESWRIKMSNAIDFIAIHGTDTADLMRALDNAKLPADQNWTTETTTWEFPDGSKIAISELEFIVS
jgi:hypothetical protein